MSTQTDTEQTTAHTWVAHLGGQVVSVARRSDVVGQFVRFVAVGGTSMVLYALLFLGLQDHLGAQPANLLGSLASAVLANELHRRLTFAAGDQVSWLTAQIRGGGMAVVGILTTSLALAWLDTAMGPTTAVTHLALVAAVNGLVGLGRFIGLRWAFTCCPPATA